MIIKHTKPIFLKHDDFIDPEVMADIAKINWDDTDEIEVELEADIYTGRPQTRLEPAEPKEVVRFDLWLYNGSKIDISEFVFISKLEELYEEAIIDALES